MYQQNEIIIQKTHTMKNLALTQTERNIIEASILSRGTHYGNEFETISKSVKSKVRCNSNISLESLEVNVVVECLNAFYSITKEVEIKELSSKINK